MKPQATTSMEKQTGRRAYAARPHARDAKDGAVSSPPQTQPMAAPAPAPPSSYPHRILLVATGLSPQVVTETIYALAVKPRLCAAPGAAAAAFVPTEVHLITTARGARNAQLNLLSDDPGWFRRLCAEYGLAGIRFGPEQIHVIGRADGSLLDDIRDEPDNTLAADFIAEQVRGFTARDTAAVHASIAGGRKTMGFYLGYAMSLFGRAQDRLSHVLVSPPFESHPQFYYPTTHERVIHTLDRTQDPLDCRNAVVSLGDIPFVRMRHGLEEDLRSGRARYSEAVGAVNRALGPPELIIDLAGRRIRAAGIVASLPPAELALYALFARRTRDGKDALQAPTKDVPDPDWAAWFLHEYDAAHDAMADTDATCKALANGMDGDYFSSHLAKLKRLLKRDLRGRAEPYLVSDGGCRPRRYCLDLPREAIRFGRIE